MGDPLGGHWVQGHVDGTTEVVDVRVLEDHREVSFALPEDLRDYLVENRIPVVSEDTWGGEITTSAVAHFATSTPQEYLVNSTDLHNYNTRSTGIGGPHVKDGKLYASDTPGLGVEPDFESLGDPIAIYGEPL